VDRFLIVRLGSLGDVIHAIPAAAALKTAYPQARVDWMVDPSYAELLGLVRCVDRVIPVDPRAIKRGIARVRFKQTLSGLRSEDYDAVLDLQGLLKSAMLARSVRGRKTIGFAKAHLREPLARFFYTQTLDPSGIPHVIYKNLGLLESLRIYDRRVRFPLEIPRTAVVEEVARQFGVEGYALINPGAAWPNKQWPPERFGALASAIAAAHRLRSLVLWGPDEQDIARRVVDASAGAAELSPPTTITDLLGIAHGARLMVSGDTGPLHIAAAAGAPIVSLFGPTRPERNGPWGLYDAALSRADRCSCLYQRRCHKAARCIDDIEVADVMAAVCRRLEACG